MKPILVLRHVPHESLGTIAEQLSRAGLAWQCGDWFAPGGAPDDFLPARYAGLVVMGGPMNVDQTDRYPFLATEVQWMRRALEAELPLLGVCLGSQLLAKTLGAKVYPNRVKEIGWYTIETTAAAADDRLLAGCGSRQTVFQWHGDTFDPPPGAVHLARSELCPQQAFRAGPCAYGLQFHVEMTAEMVEDWLAEGCNCDELSALDYIDPAAIRAATPRHLPALRQFAERVLGRFADLCRERAGA